MSIRHFSLDIETLSSSPTAVVLSIGLYELTVLQEVPAPSCLFVVNIDIDSSLEAGLTVSGSSLAWWLQQSSEARGALFCPKPVSLQQAAVRLSEWYSTRKARRNRVWAHATFDFPTLDYVVRRVGAKMPWSYLECRDLRTLLDGVVTSDIKHGSELEHSCGWDAFAQGQQVLEALGRRPHD